MLEKFILHQYQEDAVEVVLRDKHTLVKAPTGAGKTLVGVEAMLRAGTKVNLIIAPLHTLRGWRNTLARQSTHELRFIDVRKAGKQAHEDLASGVPGFYFIGRERFRTQAWRGWDVDFAIVDEVQSFTNRKSQSSKMLLTLKPEYALELSATPAGNNFDGFYAISRWLWPAFTGASYWKWVTQWCRTEVDVAAMEAAERRGTALRVPLKKVIGELNPGAYLRGAPSYVQMPSVYNKKPSIFEVEVTLNPTQRKHYKEFERDAITFLEDNPLVTDLPSVKYMRLIQMTLATPSIKQDWIRKKNEDTQEWETVWGDVVYFEEDAKSSKADAIEDLLEVLHVENPEPVLVFTHSRKFATFLALRLQKQGYRARQWVGGMSPEERQWKLENFGVEFDVLVATIPTIGEGTDSLQDVCHNEIWASVSDSRYLNFQAQGRLSRQGQKKTVNRYVLLAKDTVETEKQHPRLIVDQAVLDASYDMEEIAA